jgi:hypothetical protein
LLILDEKAYVETVLLKDKKFGNYLKLKDAVMLAKYYKWIENKETREIKRILISICKRLDKNWNSTTQSWKINLAIRESKKRRIRTAIPIPITNLELEKIREVDDYNLEKILFTFLVYAKFLKYSNTIINPKRRPRLLGLFYANEKLNNIFSVAKVDVRKSQRTEMIHFLFQRGLIDATRYGGYLIKYVFEDSSNDDYVKTEFTVDRYDDLVLYYLRWRGEQVSICSCGRLFVKKSPNQIRCSVCAKEYNIEKWRNLRKDKKQSHHSQNVE